MGIHQRFHRYVPRFDYLPEKLNVIGDDSSRLFKLTNAEFLQRFNFIYPQSESYHPITKHIFQRDFCIAQANVQSGVTPSRSQ